MAMNFGEKYNQEEFDRKLKVRINTKLQEYEDALDARRKKLEKLMGEEERVFTHEVVDQLQKVNERKLEEARIQVKEYKEKREAERLAIVKEKRLQQYVDRCSEFRPKLAAQRKLESVQVQLLQMEENKSKKEAARELEKFWFEMGLLYNKAIDEREEQSALHILKEQKEFLYYSALQKHEKEVQQEKERQEKFEEFKRLEELKAKMEQEDLEALEKKRKRKMKEAKELADQVAEQKATLKQRTEDELKITRAYDLLAEEEIRKEQEKMRNKTSTATRDMHMYKQYLSEIKAQKKEAEEITDRMATEQMNDAYRKKDAETCKAERAKRALRKACTETNAKMVEEKHMKEAEEQKKRQVEYEYIEFTIQQNDKLKDEQKRQKYLSKLRYRDVLNNQIAYTNLLKERERENMKRILNAALEEEEMYEKTVREILKGEIKISEDHPFYSKIKNEKCPCPKPSY